MRDNHRNNIYVTTMMPTVMIAVDVSRTLLLHVIKKLYLRLFSTYCCGNPSGNTNIRIQNEISKIITIKNLVMRPNK